MENTKKYGINYIDGIMFFGDYTFLPSSKKYYLNDDTINILNKNYGQINSIEELGYKPIGKDSVGLDYFRLLKYDGVNIKYSIAVYNSWSNEIIIYDDFEKNDWNPPKKDDIDDDELKFIGTYPWTVGADGVIYFFDADDKKAEYQIKKIENRWHKDFGIDKKQIGHCNSNDIPLYTEKNVTSKTEVFNYCNDCLWILKKDDKFCKVRKIDDREGWIETKYIDFDEDEPTKSAASKTNVAVNKEMSCADNLRLRSEEATSSKIITTMAKGTKVKILKLGKAETIDGINSNWVQVEILSGAKDIDGKTIKPGTIGWCYGGYLGVSQ
ncbi:MAG: SH3 domain-containing protein [Spirochaetaceae bacterium]|nr:SH3 domain-containing protein [Spirochaetaceae bacterium]